MEHVIALIATNGQISVERYSPGHAKALVSALDRVGSSTVHAGPGSTWCASGFPNHVNDRATEAAQALEIINANEALVGDVAIVDIEDEIPVQWAIQQHVPIAVPLVERLLPLQAPFVRAKGS